MVSRIFFICVGLLFALYILRTTMRNRILERESLVWLLFVIFILVLGIFPQSLDWMATKLNIAYGPSLLFMIGMIALAILQLRQTMMAAQHKHKIDELGHKIALLEKRLNDQEKNVQSN